MPEPVNESVLGYAPASRERAGIESVLAELSNSDPIELTATIDGVSKPASGEAFDVTMPSDHAHILGRAANATQTDTTEAIDAALAAAPGWAELGFQQRAAVFLRAATCSPDRGGTPRTPPQCLAKVRPCSSRKSTRPVS